MKNFWSAPLLKPIITGSAEFYLKSEVQPGKPLKVQEASDEFFVLNMAQGLSYFRIIGMIMGGGDFCFYVL